MNWNENRWCIGTLKRGFSNFLLLTASSEYLPLECAKNIYTHFFSIFLQYFCENCDQMKVKPCFRKLLAGLASPCWILLVNDFL